MYEIDIYLLDGREVKFTGNAETTNEVISLILEHGDIDLYPQMDVVAQQLDRFGEYAITNGVFQVEVKLVRVG